MKATMVSFSARRVFDAKTAFRGNFSKEITPLNARVSARRSLLLSGSMEGERLDNLIDLKEDNTFRLDQDYCTGLTMTSQKFADLFGAKVRDWKTELLTPFHRISRLRSRR